MGEETRIRSGSEAAAMGKAGGIASGEARRRKKAMKEWAEIIGSLPAKVVSPDGSTLAEADLDADLIMQQYRAAHNGSTKAATFLANLKGEMEQKVNVSSDKPIVVVADQLEAQELEAVLGGKH